MKTLIMSARSGARIAAAIFAVWVCARAQDVSRAAEPLLVDQTPHGSFNTKDVPEIPHIDTAGFLPAVRDQIDRAQRDAREHSRNPQVIGEFAMTLHAYDLYDPAARAYLRAQLLGPGTFDWVYLRGVLLLQKGDFEAAAQSFRKALEIRPADLPAHVRLGQTLIAAGSWDDAESLHREIVRTHPDCPQGWYGLGRVQSAKGDHAAAAVSYGHACDAFPPYSAAHFAIAGELRKLGKRAEAEQHAAVYRNDVSAEPPLPDALLQRVRGLNIGVRSHLDAGTAFDKAGKLEDAIREHEAALAIDPDNVQVHINLISLWGRSGDAARAKHHFEIATRLGPGRSDAWYNYGVLMFKQQNYAEAEAAFRRAIDINPYYAEAHNNVGSVYQMRGQLDQAAKEFRDAIANKPDYPLARFQLARILVSQRRYDEAIQQLLKTLSPEDDQTPTYLYALAAAYARAGHRDQALQYYSRAHDAAAARGQAQLLTSIDRDLKLLSGQR